jgi:hypothetical protein
LAIGQVRAKVRVRANSGGHCRGSHATPRLHQELPPQEQVRWARRWRRRPANLQPTVGHQSVPTEGHVERVERGIASRRWRRWKHRAWPRQGSDRVVRGPFGSYSRTLDDSLCRTPHHSWNIAHLSIAGISLHRLRVHLAAKPSGVAPTAGFWQFAVDFRGSPPDSP